MVSRWGTVAVNVRAGWIELLVYRLAGIYDDKHTFNLIQELNVNTPPVYYLYIVSPVVKFFRGI